MQKYVISIVFALLLLTSTACKQQTDQSAIAPEKMGQLLLDLHLAEAYSIGLGDTSVNSPKRFDKNYDSLAVFYASIFKHHGTNLEQFKKSLDWYRDRPGKMDTMYLAILENLLAERSARNLPDLEPDQIPDEAGVHDRPEDFKQELRDLVPDTAISSKAVDTAQQPE